MYLLGDDMARNRFKMCDDYFSYNLDDIDLDEQDDLKYHKGTSAMLEKVHIVDKTMDHFQNEQLNVNIGTARQQYKINNEVDKLNKEDYNVNKGK